MDHPQNALLLQEYTELYAPTMSGQALPINGRINQVSC